MKKINPSKRKEYRTDWVNHLIGFVSVLLGIFIAFQLSNWQQKASQRRNIHTALQSIQQEIENNMAIYIRNQEELSKWLNYVSEYQIHVNANGDLLMGEDALQSFMERNPGRFDDLEYVGRYNDTLNIYHSGMKLDVIPESGISASSWVAANATGILHGIDYSRVALLTQIYDWTTKEIGISDTDFYNRHFLAEHATFDFNTLVKDYRSVVSASRLKHDRILYYYNQMEWI